MDSIASAQEIAAAAKPEADGIAWFETHIRPLLVQRCYACHSVKAGKQEGSRLKALELLGRQAGMWTAQPQAPEQPITAEQLRRELNAHLKLVAKG